MPIMKNGIGKSKNLVVIDGRSNAFITYNINKNSISYGTKSLLY
jgi:hypothetical protein